MATHALSGPEPLAAPRTCAPLLVVNLYYPPDVASTGQYAADICRALARRGVEVHAVAGQPSYTADAPRAPSYEFSEGVHVHRVSLGSARGRERMLVRLAGYLRFLVGAWRQSHALARSTGADTVLTFHNPPLVGAIGAHLARRRGLRFIYAVYDIHPDILLATRWCSLPRAAVWLWERVNRWILQGADTVIVLGEGMRRTMREGKQVPPERLRVIPTWATPELQPRERDRAMRAELGIADHEILLLYSGNMGIMHDLDPVLEAAAALRAAPVRILFVGDGARRSGLERRARAEGLDRVAFLPFQPEERFVRLLAASDACLVALRPGMERLAVPSRAYTILSAGRPLVTLMAPEADVARLVSETGCGWTACDGAELAEQLRLIVADPAQAAIRGRRGRQLYEERFQRGRVIELYLDALVP